INSWSRARTITAVIVARAVLAPLVVLGHSERSGPKFFACGCVQGQANFALGAFDGPLDERESFAAAHGDGTEAARERRGPKAARAFGGPDGGNLFGAGAVVIWPAELRPLRRARLRNETNKCEECQAGVRRLYEERKILHDHVLCGM